MTAETFDISVIIATYTEERWDELIAAVESVQRQSISPCEIIGLFSRGGKYDS